MSVPVAPRRGDKVMHAGILTIATERGPGEVVTLTCSGKLDIAATPALDDRVRQALHGGARMLCIDLCAVSGLDAAGVDALVRVRRRMLRANGALALVCPQGRLRHLLAVAGLEHYFTITPTRGQALGGLT